MKKKTIKKKKPVKQKIDVVIESLVNLEQRVKELIKEVNQLKNKNLYPPPEPKKYWPNTEPPFKYAGITWNYND
jgi:tetrahydromethanopterin S-methyltransferase subunit B